MIPLTDTLLPLRRWLALLIVLAFPRWSYAAPAPQTLMWTSPATNVVLRLNQPYPLTATASSGLPVTFRVIAGPAVITGDSVTVTNVGRLVLACEQGGSGDVVRTASLRKFNEGEVEFLYQGGIGFGSIVSAVDVSGGLAYVTAGASLQIVDVRDPANPRLLGGIATGANASGVQVVGTVAFVAAGALEIVDVHDPAKPTTLAGLGIADGWARQVRVAGNLAYLACLGGGLQIVDVADPARPHLVGVASEPLWSVREVDVSGGFAFVASENGATRVFDVSDPTLPIELSSFGPVALTEAKVAGSLIYAADGTGRLSVWDIQNPIVPTQVGITTYSRGDLPFGLGISLEHAGGFAYLAGIAGGLRVLDVGDPSRPQELGIFPTTGFSISLKADGGFTFLASFWNGLQVFRQHETILQGIDFSVPSLVPLTTPRLALTAVASSGLPVSLSVVSGPAILEGTTLVATGPGIVTVSAKQGGDEQFAPTSTARSVSFVAPEQPLGWGVDPALLLDAQVSGQITSMVALPDGSIVGAGPKLMPGAFFDPIDGQVIRLSASGALDLSFPSWKSVADQALYRTVVGDVALRESGELIVVCHTISGGGPGGPLYSTYVFQTALEKPEWGLKTAVGKFVRAFPDRQGGYVLAGGNREVIPGTLGDGSLLHLSRIVDDHSIDPRFGLPVGFTPASGGELNINNVHPMVDGSIIVAGAMLWPNYGGDYQPNTAAFRLSSDGKLVWRHTLDSPNWLTPAKFVGEVTGERLVLFPSREVLDAKTGARLGSFPIPPEVVAATSTYFQEPDGRLILSGTFTNYAGIPRRGLAAVLSDGSLDLSFDPGFGTTNAFSAIARQPDGALLLAGPPGTFDGFSHRGLIRLVRRNPSYVSPTGPSFYVQGPTGPLFECGYAGEVHVVRTGLTTQTNRVRVQTLAETAMAGADFVGVDSELVFLPGEGMKAVPLTILRDDLAEGTETFRVLTQFEPGSTVFGPTSLTIQIGNVDCGISFQTNAITLPETVGYSSLLAFAAENPPAGFTTRLRTRDLTAVAGRDYVSWDGSPVVSPLVPLQITDNPWVDGTRQFLVEAYDTATGETVKPGQSLTVTIAADDTLAGPARGMVGNLSGIVPVHDGWLMLGDFPTVDGWPRPGLARFTLGGDLDHTFEPPAELAGQVVCAAGTPDGGVLLGGNFNRLGTWPADGLVRLNSAGQLDAAFQFRPPFGGTNCSTAANQVRAIQVEPDGSSFLAGSFPAFFGCDPAPRLLRLFPAGQVEASWRIPDHKAESGFTFTGNGHGRRILQGNAGVFAVEVGGLTRLSEVDLGYGAPLAVLPDGGLAGLSGNTLVLHAPDGSLRAEVNLFRAEDDVWTGWQLHTVAVRKDGRLLVSGVFRSTTQPPVSLRVLTLALETSALATGQVASGEKISLLRLAGMVAHPDGPLAALNLLSYQQAEPKWWRLDPSGRPVSDLEFSRMVMDGQGQFHLALRGQAPDGYTVEVSDDLDTWTEWFKSAEINWGQTFLTPPLPAELPGRYFRLRL